MTSMAFCPACHIVRTTYFCCGGYLIWVSGISSFTNETGMYPASEGYEAVAVDEAEIARTCIRHNLSRICIPEAPWTGRAGVDFIDADDFVRMLRENHAG